MQGGMDSLAFALGMGAVLTLTATGAVVMGLCAWVGAQVFIAKLKSVEDAEKIIQHEVDRLMTAGER